MDLSSGARLAYAAAVWSARFYLRHFWVVFGVSLVPSVQRFVAVRWGDDLPAAVSAGGEILTGAVRLLLIVLIIRLAAADHPEMRGPAAWTRFADGLRRRRTEFLLQFLVLGAAFLLWDVLPTMAVAQWVAEDSREMVTAVIVSVKNPTVIAFTFVWMIGVGRELILAGDPPAAAGRTSRDG